jgi:mono/diheme cytochrome c family protein
VSKGTRTTRRYEVRKSLAVLFVLLLSWTLSATAGGNEGEAIYKARCAVCHGKDGVPKGFAKGSPAFNDQEWKKTNSLEAIEKVVAEGRKKMPAFKNKLTPEEIKAVSAYLKTL